MQRLHEQDPAGLWLASGRWLCHICLPGELTHDATTGKLGAQVRRAWLREEYERGLLDPMRLPRAVLVYLATALGSYGYAGQVQQLPAPAEGGILKRAWFSTMTWATLLATVTGATAVVWHGDADTAYTDNQQNDPSALLVSCYLGQTFYTCATPTKYGWSCPRLPTHCVGAAVLGMPGMPVIIFDPTQPAQLSFKTLADFSTSTYGQCIMVSEVSILRGLDFFPPAFAPGLPHVRPTVQLA